MSASAIALAGFHGSVLPADGHRSGLPGVGGVASVVLHAAAAAVLVSLTQGVTSPPPAPRTIELTLETLAPAPPPPPEVEPLPVPPVPPVPPPKVDPPPSPQVKPVVSPPPPTPRAAPRPAPQPRTVQAPAAEAQTYTPAPVPAAPPAPLPAPVPPAPPAPPVAAAPPAPRIIESAQIPGNYVSQVHAQINRNASYPAAAKRRSLEGRVGYRLTLSPAGQLIRFEIDSSGIASLDEAARAAIQAAAPFPRLPDLGGSAYLLTGAIVFRVG